MLEQLLAVATTELTSCYTVQRHSKFNVVFATPGSVCQLQNDLGLLEAHKASTSSDNNSKMPIIEKIKEKVLPEHSNAAAQQPATAVGSTTMPGDRQHSNNLDDSQHHDSRTGVTHGFAGRLKDAATGHGKSQTLQPNQSFGDAITGVGAFDERARPQAQPSNPEHSSKHDAVTGVGAHHSTQPGNLEHGGTVRKHQTGSTLAHTGPVALDSTPVAASTATSSEHEKKGLGTKVKEALGLDHKQHAADSSSSSSAAHTTGGAVTGVGAQHGTQPGNLEHGGTVRKHQTGSTLAHTGPIALESTPVAASTATSSEHEKQGVGAKLKGALGLDHKQHTADNSSSSAARTNDGRAY
eukprot:2282-Heterococcus_DN1.PRE.3